MNDVIYPKPSSRLKRDPRHLLEPIKPTYQHHRTIGRMISRHLIGPNLFKETNRHVKRLHVKEKKRLEETDVSIMRAATQPSKTSQETE